MAGDFPPSSSVTGVRCSLAARITSRPTAVEPVNSRWSNGSAQKRRAKSASPLNTRSSSSAKLAATSRGHQLAEARGQFRQLDHRAVARHQRRIERTDRQRQRIIPRHHDPAHAQRLGLQRCPAWPVFEADCPLACAPSTTVPWRSEWLMPSIRGLISSSSVSWRERWPKSALMAAASAPRWSSNSWRRRRKRSARNAHDAGATARDASRCAAKVAERAIASGAMPDCTTSAPANRLLAHLPARLANSHRSRA